MLKIKPIRRQSLVDTVVERIQKVIEQGPLKAGDRLPSEAELSKQLGVSRTVVREAVNQLESVGLLSVRRGRGMFVGDGAGLAGCVKMLRTALALSPRELVQLTELRKAIECQAARCAAQKATAEDLAELQAICDEIDRPGRRDLEAMQIDFQLHRRVLAITGNELMCNVFDVVQELVIAAMVQTTPKPRDHDGSRRRHQAIVDAIRSGDPDAAEKVVRAHLDRTIRTLEEVERQRKQSRA